MLVSLCAEKVVNLYKGVVRHANKNRFLLGADPVSQGTSNSVFHRPSKIDTLRHEVIMKGNVCLSTICEDQARPAFGGAGKDLVLG